MKTLRAFAAAALLTTTPFAFASSFIATTDTLVHGLGESLQATTDVSSSFRDDKRVLAAREDAASFVASNGEVRGVRLESAMAHIRALQPSLHANDLQLAQAILTL
ncbi:DUF2388 domain-containing protein [Pseudomonas matsuisoli]|uniref:Holliday junction resolvasome, helicase subunit n=1 Tax=Pseudomonas matsuisoli TaxID=1515666 RepID=A0A917PT28_9PSED|nr:DUF2388 domain-containing protein [Pseudomonas matsuisoli]GGJ90877.1 hypothetical protein GCM10009304_15690 [Pseudomonas matsuisoli]